MTDTGPIEARLAGRYAYEGELAEGATGRVMLVRDVDGSSSWVAKAVPPYNAACLAAELDALLDVRHASIVRPRELLRVATPLPPPFALPAGAAVLVEELVAGEPLAEAPCESWEELAAAGQMLAEALAELHRVNLVHGDVSPFNVLSSSGRWVLVDLGHAGSPLQAGVGAAGTPGFMAPEAFAGARTPSTDLFALGATLLAAAPGATSLPTLAGLADAHEHALRLQHLSRERLRDAPHPLAEIITTLLAPSPSTRPSDAQEVARRFEWEHEDRPRSSYTEELAPLRMRARRGGPRVAGALRNARFVGHEGPLRDALERIRDRAGTSLPPTLVRVIGPAGSGRDRFAQEFAQRLQRMAFDAGFPVPTIAHGPVLPTLSGQPVVVRWTPPTTEEGAARALRFLDVSEVERSPSIIVVCTDAPLVTGSDDARLIEILLGPLTADPVRELLYDALREHPTPDEVDAALALTGGLVGSLVEQLAAHAIGGDFLRARDLPTLRAATLEWAPPPLPTATLELLERCSMCADGLPLDDDVPDGLSLALTLGLLAVDHRGDVVARADVRARMLAHMTAARRKRLAADLLGSVMDPLGRAHLAVQAGLHDVAESELARALAESDDETASPARAARVYALACALPTLSLRTRQLAAQWLQRRAASEHALALLEREVDAESLALHAEFLRQQGRPTEAVRSLASARGLPGAHASEVFLRSAGRLAIEHPDLAVDGVDALLAAFAEARPEDHRDSHAFCELRALAAFTCGDVDVAEREAERAATLALQRDALGEAARGLSLRATIAQRRGDAASAYALGRRALTLAEAGGERLAAAVYGLNLGLSCFELGNLGEALSHVRAGADTLAELGRDSLLSQAALNLAQVHTAFGDDTGASALLPLAARKAEAAGLASVRAHVDLTWAAIELRRGKLLASVQRIDSALERVPSCPPEALPLVHARAALALAEANHGERARGLLTATEAEEALPHADAALTRRLALGTLALGAESVARRRAVELLAPAAADPRGWERQLQATLLISQLLERLADAPGALAEARRARVLLDTALDSLPNHLRPLLLETVRYQAALRVPPLFEADAPTPAGGRDVFRELPLYMQRFVSAGDPGRLLQRIADAAQALTRAERGFVVERLADGGWLTLACTDEQPADVRGFSRSVAGRALATGRTVSALDAIDDTRLNTSGSVLGIGTRSVLAAPLHCVGRYLALYVDDRRRPAAFDRESEEVFAACAQLAGLSLTASWDAAALREERKKLAAAEATLRTDVESQRDEITSLRRAVTGTERGSMIAGPGPMRRALELAERAAASSVPVLILGESGTGKELVARFVHDQSARRAARFVSENCAAIPDTLLESALFGHERGAFTGADRARQGLFHSADGGTLFLDEIGEMSPAMQSKLLRVLQDGQVRPVGGTKVTQVDVRLVTATHRDLLAMVADGRFREDLYYRITVVSLRLPPLRERANDVPLLVRHFLRKHHPGTPPRVTPEAMRRLASAPWPGNVRQLENEVQRLLVMEGDPIEASDVLAAAGPTTAAVEPPRRGDVSAFDPLGSLAVREHVDALERALITAALERTGQNQTRAALELGVSRYGLQKMMKRLGLRE
ncbi:MAG: sigma 54-interacting transcriptional regulator [Sandaracinaceae bacterium]|nr:sigma 54-interacting transcriptional regulator [Sandaracinaceae bacterium]